MIVVAVVVGADKAVVVVAAVVEADVAAAAVAAMTLVVVLAVAVALSILSSWLLSLECGFRLVSLSSSHLLPFGGSVESSPAVAIAGTGEVDRLTTSIGSGSCSGYNNCSTLEGSCSSMTLRRWKGKTQPYLCVPGTFDHRSLAHMQVHHLVSLDSVGSPKFNTCHTDCAASN